MMHRLGLMGLSGTLLLGHLFSYFPAMRQGISLLIALVLIVVAIAAAAGVGAMFLGKHYLTRTNVFMGALPAILVGLGFIFLLIVGAMI